MTPVRGCRDALRNKDGLPQRFQQIHVLAGDHPRPGVFDRRKAQQIVEVPARPDSTNADVLLPETRRLDGAVEWLGTISSTDARCVGQRVMCTAKTRMRQL